MKRVALVLGTAVLALLTACAPLPGSGSDVEERILAALPDDGDAGELRLSDVLPDARWDRAALACPYDDPWAAEERLGAWGTAVPDLSQDDTRQAIVLAEGSEIQSVWTFDRERVDLCGRESHDQVFGRDAPIPLTRDDGRWIAD